MADPLARRPRRDLCLPRWLCSARTPRRKGRQRAGAGRRRRPVRRAQASARPRTVRGESFSAWKGCLDDLVARGLRAPLLAIIDGNAGLRRAVELVWRRAAVQRCCVHKLRNLERKSPKHALAEIRDDFHLIVYAANAEAARTAYTLFERTWGKRCSCVVTSLREGGEELLTFSFPKEQWKTLRTTNTIERLHEEFRRRVKTQSSLPTEDSAVVLLFSLVANGQIRLRRVDGWQKIATVLSQNASVAA